jgi:uncharacterized membrane protein YeaQ/YmgE (transglycosylase-associated protein family)
LIFLIYQSSISLFKKIVRKNMSFGGFLALLLVAAICGSIGAAIAGYKTQGCVSNIALGLVGALIGTWLSRELNIKDFFYLARIPIVWSVIGASIFLVCITAITGNWSTRKKR